MKKPLCRSALASISFVCMHLIGIAATAQESEPLNFTLGYTADLWSAATKNGDKDPLYLDLLTASAQADLAQLIGWKGASLHASALYSNGESFSARVGDAQIVSNIETGQQTARIYEAWFEQSFTEATSLKVGLYDLNSEFDVLEAAGLFINSAHGIGSIVGLSGLNGPSIFPVTSFGARLAHRFAPRWHGRLAILDGVPDDFARKNGKNLAINNRDGALIAAELETPLPRQGRLLLGHWRYTSKAERLDGNEADAGNKGVYLRGETVIFREPGSDDEGLEAFLRLGRGSPTKNALNRFVGAGLNYRGLIPGRANDQTGLALAAVFTSSAFRDLQGVNANNAEMNIELTHRFAFGSFFALQPDLQYIINPSANPSLDDVLAVGLRADFSVAF